MTGNLKLLINFVEKFMGTVKFENDQIAPILGYGDLVQGAVTIKRVFYVEGLNHNLFFVGSHGTDLYSITLQDTNCPNPIFLMAKATSSLAWLWHRRLFHLNFDTTNLLSKNDIVVGLPKLKFVKDHLCSSCELGKAKRKSFHTKPTPSSKRQLQLLHMDLCGPMRVLKLMMGNFKLLINFVEKFLGTVKFGNDQIAPILGYGDLVQGAVTIKRVYYAEGLNHSLFSVGQFCDADLEVAFRKSTCYIRDLKGNDLLTAKASSSQAWLWHRRLSHLNFDTINLLSKNDIVTLYAYFAAEGILHQTSVARTPEQNGVVERRNRTLVEAARTMLSAAKALLFF
nr:hypothetical protein [Tanacetum cinerariifolium]